MKKTTYLRGAMLGLLLACSSGFSAIPDSIWKNDTLYHDLWNKASIDDTTTFWPHHANWSVRNAGTDSAMIVTDGLARPTGTGNWTNLVWAFQSSPEQKNIDLRFTWRFENPANNQNSGFNLRGFCQATTGTIANKCGGGSAGWRINGPQMDLGPTYTGNVYNSGNTTLDNAKGTCKLSTATFQDLSYRIRNDTIQMSYYPNGFDRPDTKIICTNTASGTYALTISQHLAANSPGIIALQYESTLRSNFKNIKIRNLDGVGGPSPIFKDGVKSLIRFDVVGNRGSLDLNIGDAGKYSVQISDLNGVVVKNLSGTAANHQKIDLNRSGVYFVRLSSVKGSLTKKVFAY